MKKILQEIVDNCPSHDMLEEQISTVEARAREEEREKNAVLAWSIGMDLHRTESDSREIGSIIARHIRDSAHTGEIISVEKQS